MWEGTVRLGPLGEVALMHVTKSRFDRESHRTALHISRYIFTGVRGITPVINSIIRLPMF